MAICMIRSGRIQNGCQHAGKLEDLVAVPSRLGSSGRAIRVSLCLPWKSEESALEAEETQDQGAKATAKTRAPPKKENISSFPFSPCPH